MVSLWVIITNKTEGFDRSSCSLSETEIGKRLLGKSYMNRFNQCEEREGDRA